MRKGRSIARESTTHLRAQLDLRTRERDEALEQQATTSEILKVISRSTFDLQPVLETLLEKAVRLCGADMGLIHMLDGHLYHVAASYGLSKEFLEKVVKPNPIHQDRSSATGRAVLERRVVHIHDILADPDYRWGKDHRGEEEMHRTILAVPMLREDAIIGVVVIRRVQVQPFTDKQIALVTNFAAQAVIAIENARLLSELRQRTNELAESLEQQTATSEVLRVISGSPGELVPVFQAMLQNATRLCDASFGNMLLYEEGLLHRVALHNTPPKYAAYNEKHPFLDPERVPSLGRTRAHKATDPYHRYGFGRTCVADLSVWRSPYPPHCSNAQG